MTSWSEMGPVVVSRTERFVLEHASRTWDVQIMVPRGDGPFPSMLVLDPLGTFLGTASVADVLPLTTYGAMPPVAVIGVGPLLGDGELDDAQRFLDFTPTDSLPPGDWPGVVTGGADAFLDLLGDVVLPHLEARFPLDPSDRALTGWSLSGLLTCYALVSRPWLFRRHVAVSPSLWWDDCVLLRQVTTTRRDGRQLLLTAGEHEGESWVGQFPPLAPDTPAWRTPNMVEHNAAFAELVRRSGAQADCLVLQGESHETTWWNAMVRSLVQLYGRAGS